MILAVPLRMHIPLSKPAPPTSIPPSSVSENETGLPPLAVFLHVCTPPTKNTSKANTISRSYGIWRILLPRQSMYPFHSIITSLDIVHSLTKRAFTLKLSLQIHRPTKFLIPLISDKLVMFISDLVLRDGMQLNPGLTNLI